VGLEVHEQPRVASVSDAKLKRNMVFTVEPGVYVEGVGGVRIEDTVTISQSGLKILTHSTKKMIVL
jgi:Xaa-Pro aminopeptidase